MFKAINNQDQRETLNFVTVTELEAALHNGAEPLIEWDCFEDGDLAEFPCAHTGCSNTVNWPEIFCWKCGY